MKPSSYRLVPRRPPYRTWCWMASWSWRSVTMPRSLRMRARMGKSAPRMSISPDAAGGLSHVPARCRPHASAVTAMALRLNSLKTRTALGRSTAGDRGHPASLNARLPDPHQAGGAAATHDRAARRRTFAQLTKAPICAGYDELLRLGLLQVPGADRATYLSLNPDVRADPDRQRRAAQVAVRLRRAARTRLPAAASRRSAASQEPERLEAVKRLEPTLLPTPRRRRRARRSRSSRPTSRTGAATSSRSLYQVTYANLRPEHRAASSTRPAA